jgi:hypothetical protein
MAIAAMSPGERRLLASELWTFLLHLPKAPSRTGELLTVRPFSELLKDFPHTQQGEPSGAILQGLAFAYYRADAPNVTLETSTVRAGRARRGGVGDIDGWSGDSLVLSIEVKDIIMSTPASDLVSGFLRNLSDWPDATAIVVARSFSPEAKRELERIGIKPLDRDAMGKAVNLWDLRKQQMAMREFAYFLSRVQRSTELVRRLQIFVKDKQLAY